MEKLIIFDTTLRDGEQCPGASMTPNEKLAVAKMLDRAGVDIIEAGFAASSDVDKNAIIEIAKQIEHAKICSLSRAIKSDIQTSWDAVKYCNKGGRIHTFLATSPLHREFKLKKNKDQILEMIENSVSFASSLCQDVEWTAEDATRTELDFLAQCVEKAIKCGAKTINLPDTVGYATPNHIRTMVKYIINNVPNIHEAVISMHGQNDLGLATANTLAGIEVGARQVELTINGIGERAGNTSFEEVIMTLKTRNDIYDDIDISHINTKLIKPLSDLISNITGFVIQNNKAIVGRNAFAHESGIHQDGMLKNRQTYEIMNPQDVGIKETKLVLGKHSGRNALKSTIERLGFTVNDDNHLSEIFIKFKSLASSKKHIGDADIVHIMKDNNIKQSDWSLFSLKYSNENGNMVEISILKNGKIYKESASGNGTVDAIFKAIKTIVGTSLILDLYQVHSVTGGTDALGSVTVRLRSDGSVFTGHASDLDVLKASAMAYLESINLYDSQ